MNQAALSRAEHKQWGRFDFLKKKCEIFFGHGQAQVRAQPGFQAQPGLQ